MRNQFLIYGSPLIEESEIDEVLETLRSCWLGTGPRVKQFEDEFRDYKQTPYAVAVNSGTAALHLAILAAGIGVGDNVITTSMTFCSTVNAIIHSGATPVLCDCNPESFCLDPEKLEEQITSRTKAVLVVHFGGNACDMDKICKIVDRHGLILLEDCAHAVETSYRGMPAGTMGHFGCFSFYATKNLVTGEGGMVITSDQNAAGKIKVLALHGLSADAWSRFSDEGFKHYEVIKPGFKYNMMDLQAALGIHQLRALERHWERRKQIWEIYHDLLSGLPIKLPAQPEKHVRHAYHLFPILVEKERAGISRDDFLKAVQQENIGLGVHYRSIPNHRYYRETFGWRPEDYPVSYRVGESTVSLPLSPKLTDKDVEDVVLAVKKVLI